MADDNSSHSPEPLDAHKPKKRRLHGACDTCRKRKIKCDSATMPGNSCTNCQMSSLQCTHDLPRQPKKKDTQQAYITNLEDRLDRMERLLQSLHPEKDIDHLIDVGDEHSQNTSESAQSPPAPTPAAAASSRTPFTDLKYPVPPLSSEPLTKTSPEDAEEDTSEDEDLSHIALAEHLGQLSLTDNLFFGPASGFMFAKSALSLRKEMTGVQQPETTSVRRPMFWEMRPWELEFVSTPDPVYVFPEYDLLQSLVSLYFERPNIFLPIIHKPTFLKSLAAGQHLWDSSFGMTVLMVCAMGSRYSNDRRVLQDGDETWISSGWKYFCQIPIHRNSLLQRTSVYDLQYYCLAVTFLLGTTVAQTAWSFLGLGIRFALEKGIHRRRGKNDAHSVEYEHLKRAFWCLVCIDRLMSSALGRPSSIADEDFDVDYPVECDDEYWEPEDPEQAFRQPPGKPCQLSAFICHIKLCEILAFTLRTLYSTKKSKMLTGLMGVEWEQRLVAELDSSMNKWKDSLPSFLQWQAEMPDNTFFHQSSCLHATYYYIRIQIHRPFLTRRSPLTMTSLTMCTSAARSCCHVLETSITRGMRSYPNYFITAFSSAIVMLINMWGAHRSGVHVDQAKEMENIQRCFRVLKECEKRWHLAGRLYDKLNEVGPLREYRPTAVPKRRRDDPTASTSTSQTAPAPATAASSSMAWNQLAEEAAAPPTTMAQPGYAFSRPGPGTDTSLSSSGVPTPPVQPQQLLATANAMQFPQIDMYSSAASMHANDWDFISNMLKVQFQQQQQQQQFGASNPALGAPNSGLGRTVDFGALLNGTQQQPLPQQVHGVSVIPDSNTSGASVPVQVSNTIAPEFPITSEPQLRPWPAAPGISPDSTQKAGSNNEMPFPLENDLFTVWSDGPTAFNMEEWDSFLGGMFDRPLDQQ